MELFKWDITIEHNKLANIKIHLLEHYRDALLNIYDSWESRAYNYS
jgi:hypothetical protein